MPAVKTSPNGAEFSAAIDSFDPRRFGFERTETGWRKRINNRLVEIAPLFWQHVHYQSYDIVSGERVPIDALNLLVKLQQRTWGMPPEGLVPANILAIIPETGASVIVAYDAEIGFNADGWLGFVFGLGAQSGTLVSHMLGVREDLRGSGAIGWYLKIVQAFEALKHGHGAMIWTYDPMRGANARLNLEKLGAPVKELTIDKYGALVTELYGDVPSDRFTACWNMLAPATAERLRLVAAGEYRSLDPGEILDIPEVNLRNVEELLHERPPRIKYRIPGDIDDLARTDPQMAVQWRQEMRQILTLLLTTKRPIAGKTIAIAVHKTDGDYVVNAFSTNVQPAQERQSYYLLDRIDDKAGSAT
jgi:chorismate synthase